MSYQRPGIAAKLAGTSENVPGGKKSNGLTDTTFRTLGEFRTINDIRTLIINFFSNDVPVTIGDVGVVEDTLEDETTRTFVNGNRALTLNAYKQSGSNTVKVADDMRSSYARTFLDILKWAKAQYKLPLRAPGK